MTHKIKGRQKMRCLVHRRKKKIIIFLLIKLLHGEKEKKHCYSVVLGSRLSSSLPSTCGLLLVKCGQNCIPSTQESTSLLKNTETKLSKTPADCTGGCSIRTRDSVDLRALSTRIGCVTVKIFTLRSPRGQL